MYVPKGLGPAWIIELYFNIIYYIYEINTERRKTVICVE